MEVKFLKFFQKNFIKMVNSNNQSVEEFKNVMYLLLNKKALPDKYNERYLKGLYSDTKRCEVIPNWIMTFRYEYEQNISHMEYLLLINIKKIDLGEEI